MLLHDAQELGDDLGARADHDLALAGLLSVVDALQGIVEDGGADHGGVVDVVKRIKGRGSGLSRFSRRWELCDRLEVSVNAGRRGPSCQSMVVAAAHIVGDMESALQ